MLFHPDVIKQKKILFDYLNTLGIPTEKCTDEEITILAFVHKSYASDYKENYNHNERLEFLGDGILGACMNKILFLEHPEMAESELTLYKIAFVREETLADVARDINLGKYVFISNGEEKMKGREKDSILSDTLEAVIGAVYLSLGREVVEKFIRKYIYIKLEKINTDPVKSYKTLIQEFIQKEHKLIPEYKDKENKIQSSGNVTEYKSEVYVLGEKKAEGLGISKKKAQESAAKSYYNQWIAGNLAKNS